MSVLNTFALAATLIAASTASIAHAGSIVPGNSPLNPHFDTIIGGQEVTSADPVSTTTVLIVGQEGNETFICSGSIIDKDLVLTAAHCLGDTGRAQLLAVFRTSIQASGKVVKVAVQTRMSDFTQKASSGDRDWDDLALIRLSENIPAGYKPAKLLSDASVLRNGAQLTLAGYGINVPTPPTDPNDDGGAGVLRKVTQTVVDAAYSPTELLVSLRQGGSCHGDSGGPALVQNGNDIVVVGVASRLTNNDQVAHNGNVQDYSCSVDMVYTSVLAQQAWISAASQKLHAVRLQ
jgi:secreted trypsin-like serine protease